MCEENTKGYEVTWLIGTGELNGTPEEVTELTQFFTVFIETCWEWKSWLWATLSNYFYGYWILTSDPDLKSANVEIRRKLERDFFLRAFRPCASQGMVFQLPQTFPQGRLAAWRLGDENGVIYHWYIWGSRTQKNSINTGDSLSINLALCAHKNFRNEVHFDIWDDSVWLVSDMSLFVSFSP